MFWLLWFVCMRVLFLFLLGGSGCDDTNHHLLARSTPNIYIFIIIVNKIQMKTGPGRIQPGSHY